MFFEIWPYNSCNNKSLNDYRSPHSPPDFNTAKPPLVPHVAFGLGENIMQYDIHLDVQDGRMF